MPTWQAEIGSGCILLLRSREEHEEGVRVGMLGQHLCFCTLLNYMSLINQRPGSDLGFLNMNCHYV